MQSTEGRNLLGVYPHIAIHRLFFVSQKFRRSLISQHHISIRSSRAYQSSAVFIAKFIVGTVDMNTTSRISRSRDRNCLGLTSCSRRRRVRANANRPRERCKSDQKWSTIYSQCNTTCIHFTTSNSPPRLLCCPSDVLFPIFFHT